jgi:hypothetical protein
MFDTFTAVCLPYCLQRQADGRYAVLNREYKPVGFNTQEWVEYENYPVCMAIKGLGPAMAKKLSCKGSDDTDCIQLYNDGCNPCAGGEEMRAYSKRLALLTKLKVA